MTSSQGTESTAPTFTNSIVHPGRPGFGWALYEYAPGEFSPCGRAVRMPEPGEIVEVVSRWGDAVGNGRYVWRYEPFWQTEIAETFVEIAPGRTMRSGGRRASFPHPITGETTIRLQAFDAETGEVIPTQVFDAKFYVETEREAVAR